MNVELIGTVDHEMITVVDHSVTEVIESLIEVLQTTVGEMIEDEEVVVLMMAHHETDAGDLGVKTGWMIALVAAEVPEVVGEMKGVQIALIMIAADLPVVVDLVALQGTEGLEVEETHISTEEIETIIAVEILIVIVVVLAEVTTVQGEGKETMIVIMITNEEEAVAEEQDTNETVDTDQMNVGMEAEVVKLRVAILKSGKKRRSYYDYR